MVFIIIALLHFASHFGTARLAPSDFFSYSTRTNKNGDAAGDKREAYQDQEEASVKRSKLANGP